MLNIAICDDIPEHSRQIETSIRRHLVVPAELESYSRPEALLNSVQEESIRPQIAVLDIKMDGLTGIELAAELNKKVPSCRIIFVTGYDEFAPEVYRTNHVWFIPKAEIDAYMGDALNKALNSLEEDSAEVKMLHLHKRGKTILVPVNEVKYLERQAHCTHVFTLETEYLVTASPAEILSAEILPGFIRCHQSYWINRKFIKELDGEIFVLSDGKRIEIGRTYRAQARKEFFDWIKKN